MAFAFDAKVWAAAQALRHNPDFIELMDGIKRRVAVTLKAALDSPPDYRVDQTAYARAMSDFWVALEAARTNHQKSYNLIDPAMGPTMEPAFGSTPVKPLVPIGVEPPPAEEPPLPVEEEPPSPPPPPPPPPPPNPDQPGFLSALEGWPTEPPPPAAPPAPAAPPGKRK